jgi:acylphosphatase
MLMAMRFKLEYLMTEPTQVFFVKVTGTVQGVGFRAWTRRQARELGLKGWVRNEPDRSVLALIIGTAPATTAMLQRFHKGPAGASVSTVEAHETNIAEIPEGFEITE